MQKFEMPKMGVEEFEIVDVIMTSLFGCDEETQCPDNNETGTIW